MLLLNRQLTHLLCMHSIFVACFGLFERIWRTHSTQHRRRQLTTFKRSSPNESTNRLKNCLWTLFGKYFGPTQLYFGEMAIIWKAESCCFVDLRKIELMKFLHLLEWFSTTTIENFQQYGRHISLDPQRGCDKSSHVVGWYRTWYEPRVRPTNFDMSK